MILKEFLKLTEGLSKLQQIMILEHVLKLDCSKIFFDPSFQLNNSNSREIHTIVKKLKALEPLEYILGYCYFYNSKFQVNSNVLIPRSETEVLVDAAIKLKPQSVLEIGTGSGCIICTLAQELETTTLIATDISPKALNVAKNNAKGQEISQIEFQEADLLLNTILPSEIELLIANLPYIDPDTYVSSSTKLHEPHLALYSSEKGLSHIKRLLKLIQASSTLFTNIMLEFGYGQVSEIQVMCEHILPQYDLNFFADFNSITRFCHLKLKNV